MRGKRKEKQGEGERRRNRERERERESEREITLTLRLVLSDEHTMDLGPDSDEQFPDPPSSQLTRWKPLSLSEVQVIIVNLLNSHSISSIRYLPLQTTQLFSGVSVINQQEKTNRFFLATFQLNEGINRIFIS